MFIYFVSSNQDTFNRTGFNATYRTVTRGEINCSQNIIKVLKKRESKNCITVDLEILSIFIFKKRVWD